jgi:hypothetical protein
MLRYLFSIALLGIAQVSYTQLRWTNVDSLFQPLPSSVHVFKSTDSLDGKPNVAYYVSADLADKNLLFSADTTLGRRLTPSQFFHKNQQPLLVVNSTFFSFETNQNLNTVIKDGKIVGHNKSIPGRGKDTLLYHHTLNSVLGISKKRRADVAWVYSDSSDKHAYALQYPFLSSKTGSPYISKTQLLTSVKDSASSDQGHHKLKRWKMHTAIGGGPVLVQQGEIKITNNEERKFGGKAIHDKHPRTAMGYTKDNQLIILVVQGRSPGIADGVSLLQQALLLKELGCWEALNLDGGGSSCLLINGKETITPSDKGKQRAVPAVFMIQSKK